MSKYGTMQDWQRAANSVAALREWLAENMPELDGRLRQMSHEEIRVVLNEVTGLDVKTADLIEEGSKRYLEALEATVNAGTAPPP